MTYRDDLESAHARIAALSAENARLTAENAELRGKLEAAERGTREGLAASARHGVRMGFAFLSALAILASCALGLWGMWQGCEGSGGVTVDTSWSKRVVTGQLDASGPTFNGTWALVGGSCASGQHMAFFGVDLVDRTDPQKILRVIEDPAQGTLLKLNVPGTERARMLARTDCKIWDVQLRPTNNYVNDIRLLDGHVALDCTLGDRSTLAGRIEFKGCQ